MGFIHKAAPKMPGDVNFSPFQAKMPLSVPLLPIWADSSGSWGVCPLCTVGRDQFPQSIRLTSPLSPPPYVYYCGNYNGLPCYVFCLLTKGLSWAINIPTRDNIIKGFQEN